MPVGRGGQEEKEDGDHLGDAESEHCIPNAEGTVS